MLGKLILVKALTLFNSKIIVFLFGTKSLMTQQEDVFVLFDNTSER